jgi:hypothetical protein
MLWLHSAPRATLHVFDLFGLPHSLASRSLVRATYPGRVHFHEGDSRVTVAAFARRVANGTTAPCDLFFVDGAHTGRTPRHDFNNAIRASRPGALVVADDVTVGWNAVKAPWEELVRTRRLIDEKCAEQILCATGRRAVPGRKARLGVWLEDETPLRPCARPRNDARTRSIKKRWCEARVPESKPPHGS